MKSARHWGCSTLIDSIPRGKRYQTCYESYRKYTDFFHLYGWIALNVNSSTWFW